MKPGSILIWEDRPPTEKVPFYWVQRRDTLPLGQYIVIKQLCRLDDWLLYDVEDGKIFLASEKWIAFRLKEII